MILKTTKLYFETLNEVLDFKWDFRLHPFKDTLHYVMRFYHCFILFFCKLWELQFKTKQLKFQSVLGNKYILIKLCIFI